MTSLQNRKRRRRESGVTLIELMVSMGLITVVLAAVISAFLAQNRLFRSQREGTEAMRSARMAITVLERYVSRAGYGVDPSLAFDFSWYACDTTGGGCCADADGPCTRDSGVGPDELVFYNRNPRYFALEDPKGAIPTFRGLSWQVGAATNDNQVELLANGSAAQLRAGQVLLVVFRDSYGVNPYTFVTVDQNTAVAAGADTTVGVRSTEGDTDAFQQNAALGLPAFAGGNARAFAVERNRFFVRADPVSGRNFLMLDRGTDVNGDGAVDAADLIPVAQDIEDLQVAYITRDGTEWGATVGTTGLSAQPMPPVDTAAVAADGTFTDPCESMLTVDFFADRTVSSCGMNHANRNARHPGNIVAVRMTVIARSPSPKRDSQGGLSLDPTDLPSAYSAENHDRAAETTPDGFQRVRLTTTVRLPNMDARGIPFI